MCIILKAHFHTLHMHINLVILLSICSKQLVETSNKLSGDNEAPLAPSNPFPPSNEAFMLRSWSGSIRRLLLQTRSSRHCHARLFATRQVRPGWEAVIGIEVHAQIDSKTKLFSGA